MTLTHIHLLDTPTEPDPTDEPDTSAPPERPTDDAPDVSTGDEPTDTVTSGSAESMPELCYLPLSVLRPHPDNPRTSLGDLTELTRSIRSHGILEPLVVLPAAVDSTHLDGSGGESDIEQVPLHRQRHHRPVHGYDVGVLFGYLAAGHPTTLVELIERIVDEAPEEDLLRVVPEEGWRALSGLAPVERSACGGATASYPAPGCFSAT